MQFPLVNESVMAISVLVSSTTGLTLTSTPFKLPSSSPHQHFPTRTSNTRTPKLEQLSAVSAVLADDHTHGNL